MAVGAAAVGTGIGILGQLEQGKRQKEAANAQASAKNQQAAEVLRRSEFNIDQLQKEAGRFRARQTAAFAASGVDIGSGASLLQAEQFNRDLIDNIIAQKEEARYKAGLIRAGADVDTRLGGDIERASQFGAISTGFSGLSNILSLTGSKKKVT